MTTAYVTHPLFRAHAMTPGHPEQPQRLASIEAALHAAGLFRQLRLCAAIPATREQLLRVHTPALLDRLAALSPAQGLHEIDEDTAMNPHSLEAATLAAGAGALAVDLVLSGHSHVYERSYLLQGDAILQSDPASYAKVDSSDGTLYVVTGVGGNNGTGPLDHPLMAVSLGQVFGFSQFDVSWNELRGRFVERDGSTSDLFALRKALHAAAVNELSQTGR